MVVREGFDYYALYNMCPPEHTPTAMHNSIVHTRNGFRGVAVADRECPQGRPHSRHLTQNSVGICWPRFKKTGFRTENIVLIILLFTYTRRLPLSLSFYVHLVSTIRNLLNLHLADPNVDDCPFSIQSAILYALLKLICYAFVHPCSFGRSRSTILA